MGMFADYEPLPQSRPPPAGVETRAAASQDLPALAALRAERDAIPVAAATANFERLVAQAATGTAHVLVAALEQRPVGYGVAEHMTRAGLPEGWYLGGVVVEPETRRRGIGARLTRERLDWIARRASRAFYFVNEHNRASIDLHAALGFREILRDLRAPGLTFTNGIGLLFAVELPPLV